MTYSLDSLKQISETRNNKQKWCIKLYAEMKHLMQPQQQNTIIAEMRDQKNEEKCNLVAIAKCITRY